MARYSTYTSPIDRMGAISQVGQGIQNQRLQREEAPIRQGLLATQAHAQTLNNLSQEQQIQMVDKKLKETDFAANAYEALLAQDDTTMLGILQQRMPDFLAAAQQEQATPDTMRERLNGLVQRGVALGVIELPQQAKQANPQKVEGVDAQGNPVFGAFVNGQYVNPQTGKPFASGEFQPKPSRTGPLVNNMGPIPQGMKVVTDEQGNQYLEEVPGGPAERERLKQEAEEQKALGKARRVAVSNIFEKRRNLGQINKIRSQANKMTTGVAAQALGWIPWTDAGALEANKKSLLAKIGFETLQTMRDNSPTGGALGQVSERELDFLQRALASLDAAQSTDQFLENLDEVAARYERALAVLEAEYDPNSEWAGMDMQQIDAAINEKYPIFGSEQTDSTQPPPAPSVISPERAAELEAKYGL